MRPVDGQRLPSAHLQFSPLFSRRLGYLHLSRIFRHFKSSYYNTVRENRPSGRRFSIPLPGSVIRLIRPFQGFTGARLVQSSRKGRSLHKVITSLLRAPPRGIPGYSLLSGGRLLAGDRHCALICVPPARHRILCLSAFRYMLTHIPQGTGTGYPRRFSPMQAFRQLPLPKASASQSGFHPAYALRSRMSRRNSLHYPIFSFQGSWLTGVFLFLSCQYRVSSVNTTVIKPVR